VPVTAWAQAGRAGYSQGPVAINYRRAHVLYRDLPCFRPTPGLQPPTASDPTLIDVAQCMRDIVAEARVERNGRMYNQEEAAAPSQLDRRWGAQSQTASSSSVGPPVIKRCLDCTNSRMLKPKEYQRDGCFDKVLRLPVMFCECLPLRSHPLRWWP
jgi:hypothetical protein